MMERKKKKRRRKVEQRISSRKIMVANLPKKQRHGQRQRKERTTMMLTLVNRYYWTDIRKRIVRIWNFPNIYLPFVFQMDIILSNTKFGQIRHHHQSRIMIRNP